MIIITNIERSKLLSYKDKKQKFGIENILFITPYHSFCKDYLKELPVNFEKIKNLNLAYKNANINTVYSIQPNLSSLLIHNFKPQTSFRNFYKKCEKTSCKICKYSLTNSYIYLNNFILPIFSNSSCLSLNCIYVLKCIKCEFYYIGQTKNLKQRIKQHLSSI